MCNESAVHFSLFSPSSSLPPSLSLPPSPLYPSLPPSSPFPQVYVLKHIGGMQESCHTCCMLEVDNVKEVCQYYTVTMPTAIDGFCRNKVPRGRSWEEARMPSCVDCGQSMNGALIAMFNAEGEG